MNPPIAVQLYSVREQLAHDFDGVIRQIAAMGYAGVKDDGERADLIAWLKQASRPGVACTARP